VQQQFISDQMADLTDYAENKKAADPITLQFGWWLVMKV